MPTDAAYVDLDRLPTQTLAEPLAGSTFLRSPEGIRTNFRNGRLIFWPNLDCMDGSMCCRELP